MESKFWFYWGWMRIKYKKWRIDSFKEWKGKNIRLGNKWSCLTYPGDDSNASEVVPLLTLVTADHISFITALTDAV